MRDHSRLLPRFFLPLFAALVGLFAVSTAGAANPWQSGGTVFYSTPGYTVPPAVAPRKAKRPRAFRHKAGTQRINRYLASRRAPRQVEQGIIRRHAAPYRSAIGYRHKAARRFAARQTAGRMTTRVSQRQTHAIASAVAPVQRIAALADRVEPRLDRSVASYGGVEARIDIKAQRMVVKIDGEIAHVWKVSTARKGYVTPRGVFGPQRMHKSYFSRKYYNSPMPYSIFFKGGYAVHGTTAVRALGGPASHGCIRLATGNARALFNLMKNYGPRRSRIVIT